MTPGARVAAATSVLDAWQGGLPVEQALTRWARAARYAGAKDRAAVRDHVFDALRTLNSAAMAGGAKTGRAIMLGLLRLQGVPVDTVFTGEGYAPAILSAEEVAHTFTRPDPTIDVPDWLLPMVEQRAGPGLAALCRSFQSRAPVYLRVNRRNASDEAVIASLLADGVTATRVPDIDGALVVIDGARRVRLGAAYQAGWFELQDLSVQRAIVNIDWRCDDTVLDYCAGGGGKTLAILDRADGVVLAHDADPRRLKDLPVRAARAGVEAECLATNALTTRGPFDTVLCDVPCSGSGTWRRDPENKWRLTPSRLAHLKETQAQILQSAQALVRPGGRLAYMTCSLFHAENEDQITRFLDNCSGWTLEMEGMDTPLTCSDGFYHAVLRSA